jgi:putative oxidoreductase
MEFIFLGFNLPLVAVTILRVTMGVFFSISGYHKIFNKQRHSVVYSTMVVDDVPDPKLASWLVPLGEFWGGIALMLGFLTPIAAIGLLIICCGATAVDGLKRIAAWKPIDRADYVDDVLYLPEVMYAIILLTLIFMGGGPYSLDSYIISF